MYYKNQRERGYNQSELLAKQCSEIMGIPYAELLEKHKANKAQHTLKGKERENNVHGVYRVADIELAADKTILIIDDIITTGNTLGECCKVLKKQVAKAFPVQLFVRLLYDLKVEKIGVLPIISTFSFIVFR